MNLHLSLLERHAKSTFSQLIPNSHPNFSQLVSSIFIRPPAPKIKTQLNGLISGALIKKRVPGTWQDTLTVGAMTSYDEA
ncbi:MAG: hypothetical protein COU09_02885 [Candidatus Harrisonbacteria bacterium CG10_big_fil_rev_8_21_14_0_10_44_23]|uniref:Uncharacterized protein n=1 Tax=Candidatus Harrisonbacteria bacterium CG10_big_fil_rev_8_21_14_0_10_44_23 TaxID=1974585 RepID=A0A2H0UPK7_9BACT|nr:MAG: hypothetical protein COU09_02885 [Candidatus Harrisonbacteria bacterium CG10_big_fil_rev_8_21_14_0_10_44_23]